MVEESSIYLLRLHGHYANQILFTDGGISSQPNRYIEAMELIEFQGNE